jgi:hypothetical protein
MENIVRTNAFLKTTVRNNVSVLDFIVHYLLHVSAPIGGHLQVKRTQYIYMYISSTETLLRTVVLRKALVDTRATGCKTQQLRLWERFANADRLCGLMVRVPGYRSWGPGFDSSCLQLRSYLEEKSSGSSLENREYGRRDPLSWPLNTFYQQKFALTSPTSGGSSVGIVRSSSLADFSVLKMEETCSSETSVLTRPTRRHFP